MVNLSKINAAKKKEVEKLCGIASQTEVVNRLIIFGSAVTDNCSKDSDVDICLDISCETSDKRLRRLMYDLNEACDFNCDILFYHKLGEDLKNEIDSGGVIVYAVRQTKHDIMQRQMKEKVMYDVNDIIDMLGISRGTAYSLIKEAYEKQEPFKVVRIGKAYRIPKRPFNEWAENGS